MNPDVENHWRLETEEDYMDEMYPPDQLEMADPLEWDEPEDDDDDAADE